MVLINMGLEMRKAGFAKFLDGQSTGRNFAYVVFFNTVIALFVALVIKEAQFSYSLIFSQCIGLTIYSSFHLTGYFYELNGWRNLIPLLGGSVLGVFLGIMAVGLIRGEQVAAIGDAIVKHYDQVLVNLAIALFFGIIISFFFISRERIHRTSHDLKESQIKNLDHKKQIAETRLQLLQAQIEPHFLFNSLSNVISLIESEPTKARQMLESLTRYLRASLTRSQDQIGTLRDEIALIENYLAIIKLRMDERLDYSINIPDALLGFTFPPMLLQPLVENAIHHGLEPRAEGGRIDINVMPADDGIRIDVIDNGCGLKTDGLTGFGLNNVRQRLQSLYGEMGSLSIADNKPTGVKATININQL